MIKPAKNLSRALPWLLASFGILLGAARALPASYGFATYLGSSGWDGGRAIATDASGNVYMAVISRCDDFLKLTQPQPPPPYYEYYGYFLVITALDSQGRLLYSTYVDHFPSDRFMDIGGIAVAPDGGVVVVGTMSYDGYYFAFALKVSSSGHYEWRHPLGGFWTTANAVTIDGQGNIYVTGYHWDDGSYPPYTREVGAFIAGIDGHNGYRRFFYPFSGRSYDEGNAIAVDADGNIVVAGKTDSENFPGHVPGAGSGGGTDAFVAWFTPEGSLLRSTVLQGSGTDEALAIVPTSDGDVIVLGSTTSNSPHNLFLTRLGPFGQWQAWTYLSGEVLDLAAGPADRLYLLGRLNGIGGGCQTPAVSMLDPQDFRILTSECIPGIQSVSLAVDPEGWIALTGSASGGLVPVNALQSFHAGLGDAFAIRMRLNRPPDCSRTAASPSVVWPPNGRLLPVTVNGVSDPDGDPVTLRITGIRQDEPWSGREPDASGLGTSQAWVRAHRDGKGDGRVYHIVFEARDDQGDTCTGEVGVCVPHDAGGNMCTDGGALVNSTR